jgi:hypothetical protein
MLTQLIDQTGCRHARRTDPSLPVTLWAALREAFAASHEYQSLRSRGVSHDRAIRQALGIGRSCSHTPTPDQRLCFAGRA